MTDETFQLALRSTAFPGSRHGYSSNHKEVEGKLPENKCLTWQVNELDSVIFLNRLLLEKCAV
jgi:hypothetical protein